VAVCGPTVGGGVAARASKTAAAALGLFAAGVISVLNSASRDRFASTGAWQTQRGEGQR